MIRHQLQFLSKLNFLLSVLQFTFLLPMTKRSSATMNTPLIYLTRAIFLIFVTSMTVFQRPRNSLCKLTNYPNKLVTWNNKFLSWKALSSQLINWKKMMLLSDFILAFKIFLLFVPCLSISSQSLTEFITGVGLHLPRFQIFPINSPLNLRNLVQNEAFHN